MKTFKDVFKKEEPRFLTEEELIEFMSIGNDWDTEEEDPCEDCEMCEMCELIEMFLDAIEEYEVQTEGTFKDKFILKDEDKGTWFVKFLG